MSDRVVVTGMGVVSPLGQSVKSFWAGLLDGDVATRPISRFPTDIYRTDRGGEIPDFALQEHWPWRGEPLPRAVELFLAAAAQAVEDSALMGDLASGDVDASRVGVVVGTVFSTRPAMAARKGGQREPGPQLVARIPARQFGLGGPNVVMSTGCAAGNDAIAQAYDLIRSGRADAVVAGGADELSEVVFAIFTALRALAPDYARPFDAGRLGLMVAEGGAALVLESEASARARGVAPYAEIGGHASSSDAYHLTAPHPEGAGVVTATRSALARAGVAVQEVDYVSAHGTGTVANDACEAEALRTVFGSARPSVSSIKGSMGHSQGAASALEAVTCVLAIRDGVVPGSPTLRQVDPACSGIDVVRFARDRCVDVAVNNAFSFGGNVSSVVFRRWEEGS